MELCETVLESIEIKLFESPMFELGIRKIFEKQVSDLPTLVGSEQEIICPRNETMLKLRFHTEEQCGYS